MREKKRKRETERECLFPEISAMRPAPRSAHVPAHTAEDAPALIRAEVGANEIVSSLRVINICSLCHDGCDNRELRCGGLMERTMASVLMSNYFHRLMDTFA